MTTIHWTNLAGGAEVVQLIAYEEPGHINVLVDQAEEVAEWDQIFKNTALGADDAESTPCREAPDDATDPRERVTLARIAAGVRVVRIGAFAGIIAYAIHCRYNVSASRENDRWRFRLERDQ